jgi:hypothetical protein
MYLYKIEHYKASSLRQEKNEPSPLKEATPHKGMKDSKF